MKIDNNSIENVCLAKLSPKMQDMLRKIEASFTAEMFGMALKLIIFVDAVWCDSGTAYKFKIIARRH